MDVAQSEFIILEDKVSGIRTAVEEAKLRVKDLMNSRAQKVCFLLVIISDFVVIRTNFCYLCSCFSGKIGHRHQETEG